MAEIVAAVVGEAVNRAASFLLDKKEEEKIDTRESISQEDIERLELAQIRMEAALEASRRGNIADASLLRWRRKLKHAAAECGRSRNDAIDHHAKEMEQQQSQEAVMRNPLPSFFPRRIALVARSCISSLGNYYCTIRNGGSEASAGSTAAVRRFERLADSAVEFIRFVELAGGSRPRQRMFMDPLIRHLLAGREINYELGSPRGSSHRQFFGIRPISFEERGVEAKLCYDYQDHKAREKSFRLGAMLRLSESTDIIGTIINCLQLVTAKVPHFKPSAEAAIREITQLPTQDFSCNKPYVVSDDIEHWNYHNILTEWFRPDPLCCKDRCGHTWVPSSEGSAELFPEPVIELFLQGNMWVCAGQQGETRTTENGSGAGIVVPEKRQLLKLGALFTPHASPKNSGQGRCSTAVEEVVNGGQGRHTGKHRGVSWEEMDRFLLPKAMEYLRGDVEATTYQLFWESGHGTLQLSVEKVGTRVPSRSRARGSRSMSRTGGMRNTMVGIQRQVEAPKLGRWKERKQIAVDLLKSWAAFAPDQLQGPITTWIQRMDITQSKGDVRSGST